ncbi:Fatty acid desaturase [Pseudorhodobacter antarcticus]|uniref:Fatty acid desaturase n=1 Tax=Pseudorhodobacter antarcticus TaxID=1077947 RepID=A0A1H8F7G4_9RHOB|nr:fatty acid desaturase [Pseudorhodobacter antarcticus]SEN27851.1 Fatty acid desaturase [Pseudorhodobacter antarcticus]
MKIARIEGGTLALLALTYAVWGGATTLGYALSPALGIVLAGLAIVQFSSLQHEALHGHPFRIRWLNETVVSPALTLTVPYGRFRDTHLAHHHDPVLTDPYDDPESNFFDPAVWVRLPGWARALFSANNTLLGRIVLGPIVGNAMWLRSEAALFAQNAPGLRRDWGLHALGLVPVVAWLWMAAMPWWAYLLAAWLGHGLLKIRTFLEHRAHVDPAGRTVVVEDRGPLSILFLNNNFHAVHHAHPGVPWYQLPALYTASRGAVLARNDGYVYRSYGAVFARYFLRAKDPLVHPHYPAAKP